MTALVTGEPRERQVYQGQGDARRVVGRFTDADGRPLSAVSAVVVAEPLGMLGDATVLLPDMQAAGLTPGAIIRVEGNTAHGCRVGISPRSARRSRVSG